MSAERLGQAIHRRISASQAGSLCDFGFATVSKDSGLALVRGIAVDPVPVDKSNWSSSFAADVATSGGAVTGLRVLVFYVDGQPTILTAMGA